MKTMPAGKFKAHCLSVIDEVYNKHEEIVITKHGKPMARVVPLNKSPDSIFGALREFGTIKGDLIEPITPPGDWDENVFPNQAATKKKK